MNRNKSIYLLFTIIILGIINLSYAGISPRFTAKREAIIYKIQVGSYPDDSTSQVIVNQLQSQRYSGITVLNSVTDSKKLIQMGSYPDVNSARIALLLVKESGYYDSAVVEIILNSTEAFNQGITYKPSLYEDALSSVNSASATSESDLLQQASLNYSTGSTTSTIKMLAELISRFPQSKNVPSAKYQLGQVYYGRYYSRYAKKDNTDEQWEYLRAATQVLQDVVDNYSDDSVIVLAQLKLAYCKNALRRFGTGFNSKLDDAVKEYQKATDAIIKTGNTQLAAKTQMMTASYIFEQAANKKISWDEARTQLAKVKTDYPHADSWILARCQLMNAETYYFENNFTQASTEISTLLNQYSNCTEEYAFGKYWQNRMLSDQRNYAVALEGYINILENYKDKKGSLYPRIISASMFGQAWCLMKMGQDSTAKEIATQLMVQYPNTREAREARIVFWQRNADSWEAPLIVNGEAVPWSTQTTNSVNH